MIHYMWPSARLWVWLRCGFGSIGLEDGFARGCVTLASLDAHCSYRGCGCGGSSCNSSSGMWCHAGCGLGGCMHDFDMSTLPKGTNRVDHRHSVLWRGGGATTVQDLWTRKRRRRLCNESTVLGYGPCGCRRWSNGGVCKQVLIQQEEVVVVLSRIKVAVG